MKIYLRAFSMIISLAIVLSVIAYLRRGSFHHFITRHAQDFGMSPPSPLHSRNYRICRTRIESMEWVSGSRIYEDKSGRKPRWMSVSAGAEPRELDYLEVEKWFGINCVIKVGMMNPQLSHKLSLEPDLLTIRFVDQRVVHVKKSISDEFLFDQDFFKSIELTNSFAELYFMTRRPLRADTVRKSQ